MAYPTVLSPSTVHTRAIHPTALSPSTPRSWFFAPPIKRWSSRCHFGELQGEDPQDKRSWQLLGTYSKIPQPSQRATSSKGPWWFHQNLLPSLSSHCPPNDRPANQEMGCCGKEWRLHSESQQTRRRQANFPRNHLPQVRMRASFIPKGEGLKSWFQDVLTSSFLQPFPGGPGEAGFFMSWSKVF